MDQIVNSLDKARAETSKPTWIVANTVKGKGVSFMEANNEWHYRRLNEETLLLALKEIEGKTAGGRA
jgi:transketolase